MDKTLVYAMASGGFRLGAWDYSRWNHITPIIIHNNKNNKENDGGMYSISYKQ